MEIINLDMTPSTVTPNAHAGQYDSARTIRFMLKNGGVPFTLAGTETITAEITRSDNTEVTVNVANTSSNYVDVVFDDTVCTVKGLYACELRLKDSDGFDIGSKNFALLVQRDPYDGAGVHVETVGPADICAFETTLPEPLQSVTVDVEATGGNGTPDNPNPIVGYSSANITRCGVNLADGDRIADFIVDNVTGASKDTANKTVTYQASNIRNVVIFDRFKANTQYTFFIDTESGFSNLKIVYTDNSETELNVGVTSSTSGKSVKALSGSWQSGTTVLKYDELGIMEGVKTLSDFIHYNGQTYTIAIGQTFYGGVLDVTRGKLKPCIEYPSYNGETLSGRWLSSEATYVEGTTPPTGSQVVSLDDYGSDIDLTPEVIEAIAGTNNVFADCGETEVKYLKAGD